MRPVQYARNPEQMSYQQMASMLGNRPQRRLAANKILRREGEDIHLLLHGKPVVVAHPDGNYTVSTHGYNTPTTHRTIKFSPAKTGIKQGRAIIWHPSSGNMPFDGPVTVDSTGKPLTIDPKWMTPDVVGVAEGIKHTGGYEHLPILGDALQDAGCDDRAIIEHTQKPNHGSSWLVDHIVGSAPRKMMRLGVNRRYQRPHLFFLKEENRQYAAKGPEGDRSVGMGNVGAPLVSKDARAQHDVVKALKGNSEGGKINFVTTHEMNPKDYDHGLGDGKVYKVAFRKGELGNWADKIAPQVPKDTFHTPMLGKAHNHVRVGKKDGRIGLAVINEKTLEEKHYHVSPSGEVTEIGGPKKSKPERSDGGHTYKFFYADNVSGIKHEGARNMTDVHWHIDPSGVPMNDVLNKTREMISKHHTDSVWDEGTAVPSGGYHPDTQRIVDKANDIIKQQTPPVEAPKPTVKPTQENEPRNPRYSPEREGSPLEQLPASKWYGPSSPTTEGRFTQPPIPTQSPKERDFEQLVEAAKPVDTVHKNLKGTKLLANLEQMRQDVNDPRLHKLLSRAISGPEYGETWDTHGRWDDRSFQGSGLSAFGSIGDHLAAMRRFHQKNLDGVKQLLKTATRGTLSPKQKAAVQKLRKQAAQSTAEIAKIDKWGKLYDWKNVGERLHQDQVVKDVLPHLSGMSFAKFISKIPGGSKSVDSNGIQHFYFPKDFAARMSPEQSKVWERLKQAVRATTTDQRTEPFRGKATGITDEQVLRSIFRNAMQEQTLSRSGVSPAGKPVGKTSINRFRRRYARPDPHEMIAKLREHFRKKAASGRVPQQMSAVKAPTGGLVVREGVKGPPGTTYSGGIFYEGGRFAPHVG